MIYVSNVWPKPCPKRHSFRVWREYSDNFTSVPNVDLLHIFFIINMEVMINGLALVKPNLEIERCASLSLKKRERCAAPEASCWIFFPQIYSYLKGFVVLSNTSNFCRCGDFKSSAGQMKHLMINQKNKASFRMGQQKGAKFPAVAQ